MLKTIRFVNFWPGFSPEDNILLPLLNFILGPNKYIIIRDRSKKVDLDIGSLYGPKIPLGPLKQIVPEVWAKNHKPYKSLLPSNAISSLLFTSEAYQDPYYEWEYHLGYKFIEKTEREAYLPLWYLETDLFGRYHSAKIKKQIKIDDLLLPRKWDVTKKLKFACSFIGNKQIIRIRSLNLLDKIESVDRYGKSVNNFVSDKFEVGKNYNFQVCFENTIFPGYITEKLLHAYISNNIPLWMGLDTDPDLNKKAYINLVNFENLELFTKHVSNLYKDKSKMQEVIEQPFLINRPKIENIINVLSRSLKL